MKPNKPTKPRLTKDKSGPSKGIALRTLAEKRLAAKGQSKTSIPADDAQLLIHELQVHQIELKMQNEELRKTQQELEASRSRYADLYDFAPVGYFTFDQKGLIHDVNLTGATLLGVERSTLIKKRFPFFIAPEHKYPFYLHCQQVIKTGTQQTCEIVLVRKDGARFFAQLESTAVKEPSGNPGHCRTVVTDITERKQSEQEQALKRMRMLLSEGQRIAHCGSWEYIAETQETVWSEEECRIYGIDPAGPAPVYQDMLRNNIHPDDAALLDQTFRQALRDRSVFELEHRAVRPDGSMRVLYDIARPYLDDNGRLIKYIGATLDITERKLAEARLNTDMDALTRMHELSRMPLDAGGIEPQLQRVMDTAVAIMGAERGTLQLLEGDSLHIVAHHGHQQPFLEYFASAENRASACGEALKHGERVIVPDIEESPVFAETPSIAVLRAAGVRAVQSTPIVNRAGELLGILTTQWGVPHSPDEHALWRLDLLVRQASDLIESTRAERALIENEERFHTLAEEMPHFVWEADANGTVLYANRRFLYYAGLSFEQARDGGWLAVQHPDDVQKVAQAWENAVNNCAEYDLKTRFREAASNEYRWFRVKGSPVRDESGRVIRWVGTCTDIHEISLAQEILQQSEEHYRLLFETMLHGVVYQAADGKVISMNPAAERILGKAFKMQSSREFEDPEHPALREDGSPFSKHEHPAGRALRTVSEVRNVLAQIYNPARQEYRWLNITSVPQFHTGGTRPYQVFSIFEDVTEQKKAEQALHESRKDLNRAQAVAHIGSWRLNIQRNELLWSEENHRIFGVPEGTSLSYETFLSIVHPDDREYVDRQWRAALRGEPYDIEHRIIVDGSVKWVREQAALEFDGTGALLGGFGTTQDITGSKKAEERLQESEERFRTMVNAMPQLAWIGRPDGHIYWYNQRWYDYTGTTPEQMEGWGWQSVHDPVLLPEVLEKWRTALATGRTFEMEFPLRGVDGHFRSFLTRGVPLKDASGSIVQWLGTNTDVTERRQAEDALRRAKDELELRVQERTAELRKANELLWEEIEERKKAHDIVVRQTRLLEAFFKSTITPMVFLDKNFNFIRVNEAYARAFRRAAQELPGRNYFDIHPNSDLQEIFKSVVATGEPFEAVAMPLTFPDLPELGTTYWNWTLTPLFDKHGETESMVFSLLDITEIQQAHQGLEAAARYTRSLIEASLDPLVTINVNGQIMDTNGATERITGLRREQLIGSDFSSYFTDPEKAQKGYEAVFRNGFVRDYPLEIKDVSGKTRDVLYNATVYRDRNGAIDGIFAAARDITKRKRAENKLRESQERLKFLSSELIRAQEKERKRIASELHDNIASSLSAAILGLVRASRELPEGTQGHELITRAITMVQHTVEETRRMMNLLRPPMLDDLGLLPAITWFLDQYSAIYSGLAINKDIAVEDADIPENMKIEMYRIIQEAFTNIAKHSNASAAELSLKKKDDIIELTIADNGQGFNPDAAGHAAKRGASGLGLISMKERAELAGGTILIQSSAGKGTTVCARWSAGA